MIFDKLFSVVEEGGSQSAAYQRHTVELQDEGGDL